MAAVTICSDLDYETAKETLMYRTVFWTLCKGGMIWENGIETCIISYMKQVASPGSMHNISKFKIRIQPFPPSNLSISFNFGTIGITSTISYSTCINCD